MSDNKEREHAAVARADALEAGGPRVVDPKLIPNRAAAEVSRTLMRAFADRVATEALVHARALLAAVEQSIVELRAGRFEGCFFAMRDLELASEALSKAVNAAGTPVHEAIKNLDPLYWTALGPARDETKILRAMVAYQDAPDQAIEAVLGLHEKTCPGCVEAEAMRRVLAARKAARK